MAGGSAIRTESLSKRYGDDARPRRARPRRSRRARSTATSGPNGAGKTTTIRLLLGLHRPTRGPGGAVRRRRVGATRSAPTGASPTSPASRSCGRRLTGAETLEFLARCAAAPTSRYRDELVERFQLDTDKKVRALSKGNRQKVQLVAALREPRRPADPRRADQRPRPADGDGLPRDRARGEGARPDGLPLVAHPQRGRGASATASGSCARAGSSTQGTLGELRHLSAQTVEVTFAGAVPELADAARRARRRARAPNALRFEVTGSIGPLIEALAGHPVVSLTSREPSLEEIFLHHYDDAAARAPRLSALARRAFADARVAHDLVRAAVRASARCSRRRPTAAPTRPSPTGSSSRARSATTSAARAALRRAARPAHGRRLRRLARRRQPRDLRGDLRRCSARSARCAPRRTPAARELVLAGVVGRRAAFLAAARGDRGRRRRAVARRRSPAFAAGGAARRAASAYLALAIVSVVPVFAGVGARREPARADASASRPRSRLACSRSRFALRAIADTVERRSAGCAGRRRSAGPRSCGRSPARSRSCCCRSLAAGAALLARRGALAARRDIGAGLLPARDSAAAAARAARLADRAGAARRARRRSSPGSSASARSRC